MNQPGIGQLLLWILVAMGVALVIALVGLASIARQIRGLRVPRDAGFFATLRYVPLTLVVLLDLLDFALDIFAAPLSWVILDRLGLRGLRNKAALEALIPFTQPIPTFTISWFAARMLNLGELEERAINTIDGDRYDPRRLP
jgi:hypothetical protein